MTARIKTVMLLLTEACNLNCVYCYQGNKTNRAIEVETAKRLITNHVENAENYTEIHIDLMGGEIFLEFELVKGICEWAWNQSFPKPVLFSGTTNGTLVHGEIQDWMAKNKNRFSVGLSIDGDREMHNRNRSNSYDQIDFDFFLKNWPVQGVKMTLSPESLPSLSRGVIELSEKGFEVHANFAVLSDWSNPENTKILERELKNLADYYLEHPDIKVTNMLNMPLHIIAEPKNTPVKWCGTGTHMVALDFNGNEYPCHFFMPNTMPDQKRWRTVNFNDSTVLQDQACYSCQISPVCPTCYGANLIQNGDPAIRDKYLCKLTKIRALAVSYLIGKKLANGIMKINNPQILNDTLLAIRFLQNMSLQ
jgi:uncharacterized protein